MKELDILVLFSCLLIVICSTKSIVALLAKSEQKMEMYLASYKVF